MRALIIREILLIKIIIRNIILICCGGPLIIYLIPYYRSIRNFEQYDKSLLTLVGMVGVTSYLVFYILYETIKKERMDKSLEKAYAFWGVKRVLGAKALSAYIMGIICEGVVLIISLYNQTDVQIPYKYFFLVLLGLAIFAWDCTAILSISDDSIWTFSIALIPGIWVCIILLNNTKLYLITIILAVAAGLILQCKINQKAINYI